MSIDVNRLTVSEVRELISFKRASAEEICKASLETIAAENPRNNSLITVTADRALEQAKAVDKLVASGATLPPLAGVPLAIKDVINIKGIRNTCGSRVLENFVSP